MTPLTFISPFFIVENLKMSIDFYVDKLGFDIWHIGPEDAPFWAMVGRGPVSIFLKAIAPDIKPVPNHSRHGWARWDAYISVAEPDALFDELQSRGVVFQQPIKNDGDGLRGFEVADTDGYILFFGRPWP
jgi:catechol 2,3-dioxygenase-like lactoylglutathione lyase family enzyme